MSKRTEARAKSAVARAQKQADLDEQFAKAKAEHDAEATRVAANTTRLRDLRLARGNP